MNWKDKADVMQGIAAGMLIIAVGLLLEAFDIIKPIK
jgi:hypothetical protein